MTVMHQPVLKGMGPITFEVKNFIPELFNLSPMWFFS